METGPLAAPLLRWGGSLHPKPLRLLKIQMAINISGIDLECSLHKAQISLDHISGFFQGCPHAEACTKSPG